jgi:hypothetical protein
MVATSAWIAVALAGLLHQDKVTARLAVRRSSGSARSSRLDQA